MLVAAGLPTFGYFTAALVAVAGIALASALQFALIGWWRRGHERIYFSYALLCLLIAGLALGDVRLCTAPDLATAVAALRFMIGSSVLSILPLILFVRAYTGAPRANRYLLLALAALLAVLFVVNWFAPASLFLVDAWLAPPLVLPWGESLSRLGGTPSWWGANYHVLTYLVFGWALWRAWQLRSTERLLAGLLGLCLLVQFAALLWGDIGVDLLRIDSPYLDAFSFLPFVLLMGLSLAAQLRRRQRDLDRARHELEAEAQIRRDAEANLRHIAYHDGLTGLPNRVSMLERVAGWHATAREGGGCGALLLIDLDNFKTINDGLGHHVGDRLLETIATRLELVAGHGTLLARLGGDEFVLVLPPEAASTADAQARAQQLAVHTIMRLSEPMNVDKRVLSVGASVGVAVFPSGEADVHELLRRADIALYRAKAAGRNTVRLFLAPMEREANERLELERGLRAAFEQNTVNEQFALHFQPQVSPFGEVLGAEALLRWRHPERGPLAPDKFIPLAEETGLIHTLGRWIIGEACARLRGWERDGIPFRGRLAINVSAWQLAHPHFATEIEAQVREAGVDPSRLTIELTETALVQDFDSAMSTLHWLADMGFHLALDDFGVGYSSLNYLQRLPLDVIKIDRVFVNVLDPVVPNPLAGFIVDVAHRLGMTTVAEGVETGQQRLALERMGCDGLQGYLICRPVNDTAFRQWLLGHEREYALQAADDGNLDTFEL